MELTRLPEIPYDDARRLRAVGTETVAALAAAPDVAALARRAGLDPDAVGAYQGLARAFVERLMAGAGIRHESDLAAADPHELAAATGLPLPEVQQFQAAARVALKGTLAAHGYDHPQHLAAADPHALSAATGIPVHHAERYVAEARAEAHPATREPDAHPEPATEVHAAGEDRIVLVDGVPTARIVLGGRVVEAAPIVTGFFIEDADAALARAGEHGVFLTEGATTAIVRAEGRNRPGLPIYKARPEGGELRVRVKEIRVRGAPPPARTITPAAPAPSEAPAQEAQAKKGLFGKLLKRG
jgi:hypothetical protein